MRALPPRAIARLRPGFVGVETRGENEDGIVILIPCGLRVILREERDATQLGKADPLFRPMAEPTHDLPQSLQVGTRLDDEGKLYCGVHAPEQISKQAQRIRDRLRSRRELQSE